MKHKHIAILLGISIISLTACGTTATNNISKTNVVSNDTGTNIEMGEEVTYEWQELGYMTSHPEIRETMDEIMGTSILTSEGKEGKKGGTLYIDMNRNWTNNSTLRYGFNQAKFYEKLWNNESAIEKLCNTAKKQFTDVETDSEALLASINAYYNLFNTPDGYFNGNETITRSEFFAGLYKAHNPVTKLEANVDIKLDDNNPFVNQMTPYSFVDMKNDTNYTGVMTRGEAVYTLVKMYYADETADTVENISDITNGGDITLEQALQNPDGGAPEVIYQAIAVAEKHGLIDSESRWDEGVTKAEALAMLTTVYADAKLSDSVEFEAADVNNNTQVENNQQEQTNPNLQQIREHVFKMDNGEIGCTVELKDVIESSLASNGLGDKYGTRILKQYYNEVQGKDNTQIYEDVVENLVSNLKDSLKDNSSQQKPNNNSNKDNNNNSNKDNSSNDNKKPENNNEGSNGGESLPPSDDNSGIDDSAGVDSDAGTTMTDEEIQDLINDEIDDSTDGGTFG